MAEKEYIERENLKKSLAYLINDFDNDGVIYGLKVAIQVLATQTTADVTEVKHGEWEVVDSDLGWIDGKCSACGYTDCFDENGFYNYCPECGAKMDGGKNGK